MLLCTKQILWPWGLSHFSVLKQEKFILSWEKSLIQVFNEGYNEMSPVPDAVHAVERKIEKAATFYGY